MILTKKQEEGLKIAVQRYKNGEKYTVIAGYAGTGKSTLVRVIIQALNILESDVVYATYTGKASQVLKKKGNPNCKTLHKLLWKWEIDNDGHFSKSPTSIKEKVVVVDEASMVPQDILDELMSRSNIYILFLGDPAQLEPVGGELTTILQKPHIFLDEIMRQALDSGIIRVSMLIREGKSFDGFKADDVQVLPQSALTTGMLSWADIVLCGTNKNRTMLNQKIRELQGKTGAPQDGDKLICL